MSATVLLLAACGRNRTLPDVHYDGPDDAIVVAALMPVCGCLSLTNVWDTACSLKSGASGAIDVVASRDGQVTGSIVLAPRQEHIEKFDWAGPSNGDAYHIAAYVRRSDGSRGERLAPISRYLRFARQTVMCDLRDASGCAFGTLTLNSAISERRQ